MKENKGLIHVYTGDGKGKTTAAVGLAARAAGSGLRVCYVSFHKHPEKYGYSEMESLRRLGVVVENFAMDHPHIDCGASPESLRQECLSGLSRTRELMDAGRFDLLILDEVLISVRDGYLTEDELLELMDNKPEGLELVLTGRMATQKIMDRADYVSFVQSLKHPYDRGVESRKGIEF